MLILINLTLGNFSFPQVLRLGDWRSKNALIVDEINFEDQHHHQSEKTILLESNIYVKMKILM